MARIRDHSLRVNVTAQEKKNLQAAAEAAGLTMSDFVRGVIKSPPPVTQEQFEQTIQDNVREIHRIGVNVNQIARRYNSMDIPKASVELLEEMEQLEKYNYEISQLLRSILVQLNGV